MAMNLGQLWDRLAGEREVAGTGVAGRTTGLGRQEFLDAADELAQLSLTSLRPRGDRIDAQPYSALPAQAVRGLAAQVTHTLFPGQVDWYDYVLSAEITDRLEEIGGEEEVATRSEINRLLGLRQEKVKAFVAARQIEAKVSSIMRRIIVEGNVGVQVLKDRLRVHPLRTIVAKRHNGELSFWVIKEEMRTTGVDEAHQSATDNKVYLYTLVDKLNKQVWQQVGEDGSNPAVNMAGKDGGDVRQYILPVAEIPDIDDYAYGFAWHFKGLFNEVDNLSASLGEASANAAWSVLLVSALANVTPKEIKQQWRSGAAVVGNQEHFKWLTSGVKLSDWGFVGAILNDLRSDIRRIFLMDDGELVKDVTATAVLRRAEKIESQTSDLMTALEATMQRPLVEAVEVAMGLEPIEVAGIDGPVQVAITTGSSAIQQDVRSMRALQKIEIVKKIDPNMAVDGVAALEEISRGDGFNYAKVVNRFDQPIEPGQNGQPPPGAPVPGPTAQQTPGGPQPQLEPPAEAARTEQDRPVAAPG